MAENAWVYLDGDLLPADQAMISPLDRGFLFGEAIYEVIPVYEGEPFRLTDHLARLRASLNAIAISVPLSDTQWVAAIAELVARNGGGDLGLYLQVSGGVQPQRDFSRSPATAPTVFMMTSPLPENPYAAGEAREGVAAILAEDIRWHRLAIKSTSLLGAVMLKAGALAAEADEAILLRDGELSESTAANVFIVEAGRVATPALSERLLGGITRLAVIEWLRGDGIEVAEEAIAAERLTGASEIWAVSSLREIVPVTRLEGRPVGEGCPGPLWHRANSLFQAGKGARTQGVSGVCASSSE